MNHIPFSAVLIQKDFSVIVNMRNISLDIFHRPPQDISSVNVSLTSSVRQAKISIIACLFVTDALEVRILWYTLRKTNPQGTPSCLQPLSRLSSILTSQEAAILSKVSLRGEYFNKLSTKSFLY